jgi:hypothetical protein
MIAHDSGSLSALPLAVAADELLPGPGQERVGQAYILVLLYLRACERTPAALSFGGVKGVIEILPEVVSDSTATISSRSESVTIGMYARQRQQNEFTIFSCGIILWVGLTMYQKARSDGQRMAAMVLSWNECHFRGNGAIWGWEALGYKRWGRV